MQFLQRVESDWRIRVKGLELDINRQTGCLSRLFICHEKRCVWTPYAGDVTVRDDRMERTFGRRHLENVDFAEKGDSLVIRKTFQGAPWVLEETYRVDDDALAWDAIVTLDSGEYRSCEISYHIPWPQPLWPMSFWAAKADMPSAPHRFAGIALEYGEITSGILIPALCCYRKDLGIGLLLAMPFDFRTPRLRFISSYRDPDLQVSFDWLALSPKQPARASFLLHACEPDWRPALGWLYERYKGYFGPRSTLIHKLWGGHVSGKFNVSRDDAKTMVSLGLKWHEVHGHFPAYGNYHPEGVTQWRSGHFGEGHREEDRTPISIDMIRQTIRNLHEAGAAALLYLQVSGDCDFNIVNPALKDSRLRNAHHDLIHDDTGSYNFADLYQTNSDPKLPYGIDMIRQINGLVSRYPEMDGVFLDQACYNFQDAAHTDGITAVNNHPCYMTGFNFHPHLERLSTLLHPQKVIIGNGPHCIGIMKYLDGFMAEAAGWMCDQLQYYGIGQKPMYFLEYDASDQKIERMFQNCLIYAAGFASYPAAMPSKDLFDLYIPLLQRLFRRRWVFDPDPLHLPTGIEGNVYRSSRGRLLVSLVRTMPRLLGRKLRECTVGVRIPAADATKQITLYKLGGTSINLPFRRENNGIAFDIPSETVAAVAELCVENENSK